MLALTAFSFSTIAEVQKYGDIGRLSKLNITEDELNDVLKDIMVDEICNRYVRSHVVGGPRRLSCDGCRVRLER